LVTIIPIRRAINSNPAKRWPEVSGGRLISTRTEMRTTAPNKYQRIRIKKATGEIVTSARIY
jgi:hypothetical protein